jgi:hypothetical protein
VTAGSCPVPGCENTRNSNHMMCRSCWSRVSKETQSAVYKAWRRYSGAAGRGAEPAAFREARDIYFATRERAINEADA